MTAPPTVLVAGKRAPTVLVADPPWLFNDALPGSTRGASKQYPCMPLDDIKSFALPPEVVASPSSVLFLWKVSSMTEAAYEVVRAWGYAPKTELVWLKTTKNGRRHFGMGRYVRAEHETAIIAVKGRAFPAVKNVRSTFSAPVGIHSAKPDEFYALVETLYPESERYELFSRTTRAGWLQYGNQLGILDP